MRVKFFYWLKTSLGFSNKESRGFLLLTPFLLIFAFSPYLLSAIKNKDTQLFLTNYQAKLDSLALLEVKAIESPLPLFNPADTAKMNSSTKKTANLVKIDFTEADSILLQIVPGIGAALGGRIIKYREQLGGFHSPNQLSEIYGLKPETIEEIWNYFEFSPKITRKIPINLAELDELSKHPYISYGEAKVLIAYRNQHGNYSSGTDLKQIKIFKSEWIDKISPYLSFE